MVSERISTAERRGISTLVLVDDAELELHVSPGAVVFTCWGSEENAHRKKFQHTISISLSSHEYVNGAKSSIPLVITEPFTSRFKLIGPTNRGASPFLLLLETDITLEYIVEYIRPTVYESDYGWDNFQDQIVIQTRLSKLVVHLQALKHSSDAVSTPCFFPQSLPAIRAPSFKLFDQIERNAVLVNIDQESQKTSRYHAISESFSGDRKKADVVLAPLRSKSPALPSITPTNSRPGSAIQVFSPPLEPAKRATPVTAPSTDVQTQQEAHAIILRMRARHSMQAGRILSLQDASIPSAVPVTEELYPESTWDATSKAELDEFHHLVIAAKEDVAKEKATAKNELEFYRQFLPKTPSLSGRSTPRSDSLQSINVLHDGESSRSNNNPAPPNGKPKQKSIRISKPPAKLPQLATSLLDPVPPSSPQDTAVGTTNQEGSPVRATEKQNIATQIVKRQEPQEIEPNVHVERSRTNPQSNAIALKKVIPPLKRSIPITKALSMQSSALVPVEKPSVARKKPTVTKKAAVGTAKRPTNRDNKAQQEGEEASFLSDFDDLDPEIDTAPVLPDDIDGMAELEDEEFFNSIRFKVLLRVEHNAVRAWPKLRAFRHQGRRNAAVAVGDAATHDMPLCTATVECLQLDGHVNGGTTTRRVQHMRCYRGLVRGHETGGRRTGGHWRERGRRRRREMAPKRADALHAGGGDWAAC